MRRRPDPVLLELFEQSGRNVQRASLILRDMLAEVPDGAAIARELYVCEQEGDRIAHDILRRLAERGPRRSHMDAADVHALTVALDDIVDYAEEAADQLGRYAVEAPMEQAEELAGVLVAAAEEVAASLRQLRNGMDLRGRLVEIHRLENEADQVLRSAIASLFANGIDPMVVIRWKDIFESLESAVDACETVANVLEGISLKRHAGR
jgi:uncharacterized protein Yka (UPF0111/DUF47 family)